MVRNNTSTMRHYHHADEFVLANSKDTTTRMNEQVNRCDQQNDEEQQQQQQQQFDDYKQHLHQQQQQQLQQPHEGIEQQQQQQKHINQSSLNRSFDSNPRRIGPDTILRLEQQQQQQKQKRAGTIIASSSTITSIRNIQMIRTMKRRLVTPFCLLWMILLCTLVVVSATSDHRRLSALTRLDHIESVLSTIHEDYIEQLKKQQQEQQTSRNNNYQTQQQDLYSENRQTSIQADELSISEDERKLQTTKKEKTYQVPSTPSKSSSNIPTITQTYEPSITPVPSYVEKCYVCESSGKTVADDKQEFLFVNQYQTTCGELDWAGRTGYLPPSLCPYIQQEVATNCNCIKRSSSSTTTDAGSSGDATPVKTPTSKTVAPTPKPKPKSTPTNTAANVVPTKPDENNTSPSTKKPVDFSSTATEGRPVVQPGKRVVITTAPSKEPIVVTKAPQTSAPQTLAPQTPKPSSKPTDAPSVEPSTVPTIKVIQSTTKLPTTNAVATNSRPISQQASSSLSAPTMAPISSTSTSTVQPSTSGTSGSSTGGNGIPCYVCNNDITQEVDKNDITDLQVMDVTVNCRYFYQSAIDGLLPEAFCPIATQLVSTQCSCIYKRITKPNNQQPSSSSTSNSTNTTTTTTNTSNNTAPTNNNIFHRNSPTATPSIGTIQAVSLQPNDIFDNNSDTPSLSPEFLQLESDFPSNIPSNYPTIMEGSDIPSITPSSIPSIRPTESIVTTSTNSPVSNNTTNKTNAPTPSVTVGNQNTGRGISGASRNSLFGWWNTNVMMLVLPYSVGVLVSLIFVI